jgi:multisubunit Na+/H+ antiporter MnhB subunit
VRRISARRLLPLLLGLPGVAVLGVAMLRAVDGLPADATGLTRAIEVRMPDSGVSHPVTGVLLNFRAYDTWLEVVVLLIVATVMLSLRRELLPDRASATRDAITVGLVRRLLPVLLLVSVFVLGLGTSGPGGAFQSGALLAAGGLLLFLAGYPITRLAEGTLLRVVLSAGVAAFLLAALGGVALGARALEFAPDVAGAAILVIEVTVAFSLVVMLFVLLVSASPEGDE